MEKSSDSLKKPVNSPTSREGVKVGDNTHRADNGKGSRNRSSCKSYWNSSYWDKP